MAGTESWKERRDQIARYRVLEQETTDPLAVLLLHDIVLELEADVREPKADALRTCELTAVFVTSSVARSG